MLSFLEANAWFRKKVLMFLVLVVVMVTFLEIWTVNRLSTYGEQINKLERAKTSLKMENQILENEIAEKNSLSNAEILTKSLGFEKVSKIKYLQETSSGLALNH